MKAGAFAVAVLFCLTGQAAAASPPDVGALPHAGHIMSLKVCTDELLLDLVPSSRIASVTYLSRVKASLRQWPQVAHIPVNHNTAEEILSLHPDLILSDPFIAPGLRPLLAKTGAKIVGSAAGGEFR